MRPIVLACLGFVAATSAGALAGLLTPALEMPVAVCVAFAAGCKYKDAIILAHLRVVREGLRELQAAMAEAMRSRPTR